MIDPRRSVDQVDWSPTSVPTGPAGEGSTHRNVDLAPGQPQTLLGYQAGRCNSMDSTIVSGSNDYVLVLGDWSNYIIADRLGTVVLFEPMVKGNSQRPTGQAGWFAYKRVGADCVNSSGFSLLKL